MAAAAVGADKKGGKRRLAPAVMFALLGASLLAACAPLGPQTVEPIVEQANTTEAVATIPSYAELVAKAMGGGFDPESLEPGRAAALEQLRQTFFIKEYDTDGDQQLDGPILSELGENTVQWAVDGVTPYLAGKAINEVYGGGTDTALLVSGFRPGEPLVVSVAGANAELAKQGVPANGKYLVVMSPTQAVVTDERSNPVAEVGADGVWRVVEAVAVATEVPTETPEPTAEPTPEPTATPIPEPYSHITLAPDGSALQEYLNASGARVEPAIHIGNGAFELVPAGEVLPTHIYEPETGWYEVDRDKAIIDRVTTSTWFTATGSADTLYEGLEMPMRVTTTDLSTLREVTYSAEAQEFYMVYWLRMAHLAHTFQNAGNTVDFEMYLEMLRSEDPEARIYVYSYNQNPDGSRGSLKRQLVDPRRGVTIQLVYDRTFFANPLATVVNPNNVGQKFAFVMGATGVGQAVVALNVDTNFIDTATDEDESDRLSGCAAMQPINGMNLFSLYATSYSMQHPDTTSTHFKILLDKMNEEGEAAESYLRKQLGIELIYPFENMVSVSND